MRKLTKLLLILVLIFALHITLDTGHSFAAIPHLINYQGRLTDSSGIPLNGSYSLTFRIYDSETAGNMLWEEIHTGVVISKGIFSLMLGSVTDLELPFDSQYYLEIKVADEVMSPRQRIASSAYAIRAENTEKLGGYDGPYYRNAANINSGILSTAQGGTGRDSRLSLVQAVGATDISIPTSESDMTDMSVTLNTYGTKLLILFSCPLGANYSADQNSAIFKIQIDGVEKIKNRINPHTYYHGNYVQVSMNWLATGLTPGSHTVKIRWYEATSNNLDIVQRGAIDGQRVLTVIDLD